MRLRPASVRVRLTLRYSLILAGIILVFSLFVFLFVKASLFATLNQRLEADFKTVSRALAEEPGETPEIETESSVKVFQIVKAGTLFYQTPAFQKSGLPFTGRLPASDKWTFRSPSGDRYRLITGLAGSDIILTVAADEAQVRTTLRTLAVILFLSLPIALALAGVGGFIMAGRLLKPVAAIAAGAEKISAESLSKRLPVVNPRDEFGRLAGVINRMLSRLEDAFERLRRFTADASHELRTPLTAIRSVGEVALQEDLDPAAYRDRIGSMLEEVNRLARLVDNLLMLTRADSSRLVLSRQETDLVHLIGRTAEDLRPLAEDKGQTLNLDLAGPAVLEVDEATLRMALVNILDNAVKYTPRAGTISVNLVRRDGELAIEISDTGPGIPSEHRDKIFERFYRVARDRSRDAGGAGLGLAIAKQAVEANGGRIELDGREGQGSTFRIVLPVRSKAVERANSTRRIDEDGHLFS
jgi:heavy metal sensor kinase